MNYIFRILLMTLTLFLSISNGIAQNESWREEMKNLIYSPRYFGPNAFPMPTMRDGLVSDRYEVELRGEYHHYTGDKTWDLIGLSTSTV